MNLKQINKRFVFVAIMLISCIHGKSQSYQMHRDAGKRHRGFFLSYAPGINFTSVAIDSKNYGSSTYKGTGLGMDFKIGGTLTENLILHATIIGHGVVGPKIDDIKTDNKTSVSEMMFGAGLTYYNPSNYLFSASVGVGSYTLENEREDIDISTDNGFSCQLKVGKEWWVAAKLGIGVAAYYHYTNCLNQKGNYGEERIIGNNIGIVLNATLNGRK